MPRSYRGGEIVAWDRGAWAPANIAAGEVLAAPPASDRLMAELGIPDPGVGSNGTEMPRRGCNFMDLESIEDRAPELIPAAIAAAKARRHPSNDR